MNRVASELRGYRATQEVRPASDHNPDEPVVPAAGRLPVRPEVRDHIPKPEHQEKLIKRILVSVDFSPPSINAFQCAVALANQCNAALTILHVINIAAQPYPARLEGTNDFTEHLWCEGSARMGELAGFLAGQVTAETVLTEGLPYEVIVDLSRDFDLVIVGTDHHKAGWKLFSQHTAQRVIKLAACPVMVVG